MMFKEKLLAYYDLFPFENHPFWQGVLNHDLSKAEVVAGEQQHYLRTKAGRVLRLRAAQQAQNVSEEVWTSLMSTAMEECVDTDENPSHLELIKRLLIEGGVTEEQLIRTKSTAGNAAAIALYRDIGERGSGCHLIGAGVVEHFYSLLCPKIFEAYTTHYGFSESAATTYKIHGPMDEVHANRAFSVLPELLTLYDADLLEESVRDAFIATSLHYDGMLQAALNKISYWDGKKNGK